MRENLKNKKKKRNYWKEKTNYREEKERANVYDDMGKNE